MLLQGADCLDGPIISQLAKKYINREYKINFFKIFSKLVRPLKFESAYLVQKHLLNFSKIGRLKLKCVYDFCRHFSDTNVRAMDETWYKRAVDQHSIEPESFVFSVPFDSSLQENPLITATHAVFVEHNGHRAPAAVVGIQYQHTTLASHFLNITSKVKI